MAEFGTCHEGVDFLLLPVYTGLELILYTNVGDSLDRDTVLADLTEPSALDGAGENNGYAAISLTGTWSSSGSVITYDHPGNPTFTNSGTIGSWAACYGSAISDGVNLLHFKDFGNSISVTLGATLVIDISEITP